MPWDRRNLAETLRGAARRKQVQKAAQNNSGWRGTGRIDWCRGWFGNARRVELGLRPAGHSWRHGDPSDPDDRCMVCSRRRRELMLERPISLHKALQQG